MKDFVDKDGLRIRRGESAWSRSAVRDESEVRRVLAELDELAASTLRDARGQLDALVDTAGLRRPEDVAGWQQILDLLNDVEQSVADFGASIFSTDLDDLVYATADRAWRAGSGRSIGFWRRRGLVKQAKAMRGDGVRDRRALHAGLAAAVAQRERWQGLSVQDGQPATTPGLARAMQHYTRLRTQLAAVAACARLDDLSARPADDVQTTLEQLAADREVLYLMPELNQLTDWLSGHGLAPLLDDLAARGTTTEEAAAALRWVWLSSVLDELRQRAPALSRFVGRQHSRIVEEYRRADEAHIAANAARVRRRVALSLQKARDGHPEQDALIRRQATLKSRHAPVRRLVEKAPDILLAVHPCWAMSPLVVSRMLPSERLFDTVVFDEASQVEPHDAVAAIMRGRQLIVAGDDKQLPPTTFFRRSLINDADTEPGEDEDMDLRLFPSILDRVKSIIPQRHRLRWHYRSLDERLIAFSNKEIYDSELISFPGVGVDPPLQLDVVDGRVMPGQDGSAPQEVARVVQLVLDHAVRRPHESLGVIALSQKHVDRIELALRDARSKRPELAEFFSDERGPSSRFFVKNLERVQGDERDAIILSLGYAKNSAGKLAMRFGPLNNEGGERRLNVAITRSRKRMTVVSSFSHYDMTPSATAAAKHNGPELLRLFLEFAHSQERGDLLSRSMAVELRRCLSWWPWSGGGSR